MTENIFSTLNISKLSLKENVNSRELLKQEETNLINKAVDNLVKQLKAFDNSDLSEEWIRNFIKLYFDFEFNSEYDIKTKSYYITVIPRWKDTNMIDFKKVDHLLNTEEAWK